MAKVDLDDVEKYMIGYVDSGKVRELIALFPDLIKELKAAREVVERLRHAMRYDRDPESPPLSVFIGKALIKYDGVTK